MSEEEKWYPEFAQKHILNDECLICVGEDKFATVAELKQLVADKARIAEVISLLTGIAEQVRAERQAGYLEALGDVEQDFRDLYLSYCREQGNTNPEHTTDWTTPLWGELEKILAQLKSRAGKEEAK